MADSGTHDIAVKIKKYPKIAHDLEDSNDSQNETVNKRTVDVALEEFVDFNSMLLSEAVLKGLLDCGFKRPSPIQLKAIPPARCGLDLIIQAKSGTGKTCVFVVTALETVILSNKQTQVIIVAPTREIACQIHQVLNAVGRHMPDLKCACFIGGQHVKDDKPYAKDAQIVVGSPGRICQLVQEGDISVDGVRLLVFDEADKLMEDAHQESVNWVFSKLPVNKQLLVLSATYPSKLDEFLTKYMRNPQKIQLDSTDVQLVGIKQYMAITKVKPGEDWLAKRVEHLHLLLTKISFEQCLIFCNFQDKVEPLCAKLKERDWSVDYIGAQLTQSRRLSAIRKLKNFRCRILISTDLTARGIDASKVNLVINFDIPYSSETYLHRIGRAGRFG
uniref:RNA helicase n=1 Tax=Romanomermis culicivorax TaxID=13658 RepID=A0A915HWC7_ROMCU